MKKVTIIIINYNGSNDTIDCINSIEKSQYDNYNIIVVDNASTTEQYNEIYEFVINNKKVKLIRSKENLGFAGGNNLAIKYALKTFNSDYYLLLNNDTLVNKDTINELVNTANNRVDCGIVGAKIYYHNDKNKIWYAGGKINWNRFTTIHYGEGEYESNQYNEEKEVEFITGCTMLISKKVIKDIGLLEDNYFMYYEDTDYSIKTAEGGYKLYYNPRAHVYHKVCASSGGEKSPFTIQYLTRNRKYFMKKYRYKVSLCKYIYAMSFFYISRILKIIIYSLRGELDKRRALIYGLKMKMNN
ncbi:glycosyltransferase family 2 protein [Clostridium butyricum]|uniref:glycosyltransferase family 2 protein n=1 Tax=Clostridium butyricum TaxID=1492 RepID=UPI0024B9A791|nr:glycosyltransferase family 2 protein [Clostridium butyricum]